MAMIDPVLLLLFKISLDDTDNDINDMVLVILKPRSCHRSAAHIYTTCM